MKDIQEKILSLIIPTYNMESYLARCIDSLLVKDFFFNQLDIIIVNDGSKDNSSQIAHQYEDKYPSIVKVIDKENGNYGSCFNVGLQYARGKYLRLLDADDWFNTKDLSSFLKYLYEAESDIIVSNYSFQYENGIVKHVNFHNVAEHVVFKACDFDFTHMGNKNLVKMHALTYRLEFIKEIGLQLQTGISYTDSEYCFFPLLLAKTLEYVNVDLYQYFIGREGQTVSLESVKKNQLSFYKVELRLLKTFITSETTISTRNNLLKLFSDGLYHIYAYQIIYKKQPEFLDMFKDVEDLVKQDKVLQDLVNTFTYKKIPFVFLWRKFGLKLSYIFGDK